MNKEDIIRMAREAGIDIDAWEPLYEGDSAGFGVCEFTHVELERFAALVASAERKECEKIIWDADAWIGSDAKIWLVKSIQEERGKA